MLLPNFADVPQLPAELLRVACSRYVIIGGTADTHTDTQRDTQRHNTFAR